MTIATTWANFSTWRGTYGHDWPPACALELIDSSPEAILKGSRNTPLDSFREYFRGVLFPLVTKRSAPAQKYILSIDDDLQFATEQNQ